MKLALKYIIYSLSLVLLSFYTIAQNPFTETEVWKTNIRIERPFSELVLTQIDSINPWDAYYRVVFAPNNTFRAYNIPGCGMDCIVSSYGSYTVDANQVKMTIDSTFYFKACSGDSIRTIDLGAYFWVKDDYSFRLVKSLKDEPKFNYFKKSKIKIPAFNDKDATELSRKFIYLYNRLYPIVQNKSTEKYRYLDEEIRQWKRASNVLVFGVHAEEHEDYLKTHVELVKIIEELQQKMKP